MPSYLLLRNIYLESYLNLSKPILNHLQIEAQQSERKFIIYSQSESKSMLIPSLFDKRVSLHVYFSKAHP